MLILKLLLLFFTLLNVCDAYKILVVFPFAGKSHGILGDAVVRHLLNAGHQITGIMAFPSKSHANFTHIPVQNSETFSENTLNMKALMDKKLVMDREFLFSIMHDAASNAVRNKNVQNLLKGPTATFDLVIAEWMFCNLYSSFAAVFNCPLIWVSTMEPHWMITRIIDEPLHPAYNADIKSKVTHPYSFLERVGELWSQISGTWRLSYYFELERQIYQSSIAPIITAKGRDLPSYEDVAANISLVLGNSHVSLGLAPRLPQNYKPIGGYHLESTPSALPQNLQDIMDASKDGVIFFSMGSNLKSKDLDDDMKKRLLVMFGGLKQTVFWKFEEELLYLPKNVHILKWAPQQSILAHPNCVLFITHGGLLSTTEAVHYGVPMIGIPVFSDQFVNINTATTKGFARKVELSYTMEEDMKVEIDEVLGNPSYAQKAKEWSLIYHDRPSTPGQELVHWAEHVIKTGGAKHLRSYAFLMPWYQKLYIDLLASVLLAIFSIVLVLTQCLKRRKIENIKSKNE